MNVPTEVLNLSGCRVKVSGFVARIVTHPGGVLTRLRLLGRSLTGRSARPSRRLKGTLVLELQPITQREASEFIKRHHRHHKPSRGWKFGIAVNDGEKVVGVVMVGRPVARHLDNGWTAEVNRCCTDGTKNVPSMLYGAAWRVCKAMGYKRLITYTRVDEPGTSLRASGWKVVGERPSSSWVNKARKRVDVTEPFQRILWEAS